MVQIVRIDPYDKAVGMLVPAIAQRMIQFSREYASEVDPEKTIQDWMVRLWKNDQSLFILAVLNEKLAVVGHLVASIETDGQNRWVFVYQLRLDENVGDARPRGLAMLDAWGESYGCKTMLMATGPNEKKWEKRLGFRTTRRVCDRPLGQPVEDGKESE